MEHVRHAGNQTDRLQETMQAKGRVNEKTQKAKKWGDRLISVFHRLTSISLKHGYNVKGPGKVFKRNAELLRDSSVPGGLLIFCQVLKGNWPQQWQLMGHPLHTRQILYFKKMNERGLTSAVPIRDDSDMIKGYFVCHNWPKQTCLNFSYRNLNFYCQTHADQVEYPKGP